MNTRGDDDLKPADDTSNAAYSPAASDKAFTSVGLPPFDRAYTRSLNDITEATSLSHSHAEVVLYSAPTQASRRKTGSGREAQRKHAWCVYMNVRGKYP